MRQIEKLDRSQQECFDRTPGAVVRFVVTYINRDGLRALAHAQQGRCTHETPEAAQEWINLATKVNTDEQLRPVYGDTTKLQVRAAACYPGHHDPVGCYFDDDAENPEAYFAGVAFELWSKLDENERAGVRFGMFPAEKFRLAEAKLDARDRVRLLSVAVMEIAAHTPKGISLASLSKVQRAKGRYGSGRSGVREALNRA